MTQTTKPERSTITVSTEVSSISEPTGSTVGERIKRKLITWGIYSVVISLLPVGYCALSLATRNHEVSLAKVMGRGELLLICVAISAAAVGELIAATAHRLHKTRNAFAGGNIILVVTACIWFGDIAARLADGNDVNQSLIAVWSIFILSSSIVFAGSSVVVAEACQ